jgi:hypothetical protein
MRIKWRSFWSVAAWRRTPKAAAVSSQLEMLDRNFIDPEISLIGQCHTCNERILFGQERCPQCGIKIDHDDMAPSVVNNFLLTQAVSSANTIRTFDLGVYMFLGTSFSRFIIDFPLWFDVGTSLFWVIPMIIIGMWFRRHGNWETRDREYLDARTGMKKSFWRWLAANALNGVFIGAGGLVKIM